MPQRSSFLFQAHLGRSKSSYYLPVHVDREVMSKPHMSTMVLPAVSQREQIKKPAIPPRSPSRPRPRNRLQKRRPDSEQRSHLGFLIKDARDEAEEYSRGTLGGFWVLGQKTELNGRKRNSSWYFQSEPDIQPLSIVLNEATDFERKSPQPERSWHQRNSSSSSEESEVSDIWQNEQSPPFSPVGNPLLDSDNTSCSSVYSHDDIEPTKTPADFKHLLNSAEILAEQYRSLLAPRVSMRTPLPPPVPPKHNARGLSIKTQSSVLSLDSNGNPRPRTLRRVISAHSLRRMTISSHPAFNSSSSDGSGYNSDASSFRNSFSSNSSSPMTPDMPNSPPPRYSVLSEVSNSELSHSVHTLTHHLSSALLLQDFCSPSDSMQDLNRNRKSVIQIQSLIEAYEELQEELELGRVQKNEREMVWEMNGVVGEWLHGLYQRGGKTI